MTMSSPIRIRSPIFRLYNSGTAFNAVKHLRLLICIRIFSMLLRSFYVSLATRKRLGTVLNALRHQRMNHPGGMFSNKAATCAQRLAASTNESPQQGRICSNGDGGAQRLAASTNESLSRIGKQPEHQDVLNALRHQRMNHSYESVSIFVAIKCSTPCGINE